MMKRTPVSSSNILEWGYAGGMLEVAFHKEGSLTSVYQYENVPADVAAGMGTAGSVGSYFAAHIKGKYAFTKVA